MRICPWPKGPSMDWRPADWRLWALHYSNSTVLQGIWRAEWVTGIEPAHSAWEW